MFLMSYSVIWPETVTTVSTRVLYISTINRAYVGITAVTIHCHISPSLTSPCSRPTCLSRYTPATCLSLVCFSSAARLLLLLDPHLRLLLLLLLRLLLRLLLHLLILSLLHLLPLVLMVRSLVYNELCDIVHSHLL